MPKEYERTHPWLTYMLDMRKFSHELWLLLGEVQSKCLHIASVPIKPELSSILHSTYLAKGIHATTAIEGNTLTEKEVKERIEGTLKLPESLEYQGREVDNILRGFNKVRDDLLRGGSDDLTLSEINDFNRIILENLPHEEHITPGALRKVNVGVMGYRGAPPEDCEYLLSRLCEWLNQEELKPAGKNAIAFGVIRAVLCHLYLAWIHPYGDGNGRTARLLELKILLSAGVPVPAAHLLSNYYNRTRAEYYKQLDYASKSNGDILPFIRYAAQGMVDGLQEQLTFIQIEQLKIFWRDFVYERFGPEPGKIDRRKRRLALDLDLFAHPVPADKLREATPKIALAYATKTLRTMQRDLDELVKMELVAKTPEGYRANTEVLFRFFAAVRRIPSP